LARHRDSGEATTALARKIWVLLELLRSKHVRFSTYRRLYAEQFRTFQRDLQHLRKIGQSGGFAISPIKGKDRADLLEVDVKLRSLDGSASVLGLLSALGGALGAPVTLELGELAKASADQGFLRFLLPQLVEQSAVAETYRILKAAWEVRPGPAMVRFQYPERGKSGKTERVVEPYRVLLRSGSAYLVAYDTGRKGWRMFALDRILSKPLRAGTIQHPRAIPAVYDSSDVVGFIKTGGPTTSVTVKIAAAVAKSATSRRWQAAQRVQHHADGSADITFEVSDVSEIVRWAMGFGAEAQIVAPATAVALAAQTANALATTYGD
jgi:predicted DNA-binding transcriptional regulator YafY